MSGGPGGRRRGVVREKYRVRVVSPGRAAAVSFETTTISSAEITVIGTTGNSPMTIVPLAALVTMSTPPIERIGTGLPGGGAGTTFCSTATARTATATQTVDARAPHFVLPLQNRAATSSGVRAA